MLAPRAARLGCTSISSLPRSPSSSSPSSPRRSSTDRDAPGTTASGTAIADLEAGIASQVGDVFLRGVGVAIYAAVYPHRLFDFAEGSPWPWVIGLVGIDFLYYWWHRASHVVNVLWAVHAVHHQSEDFNLAVALRQPAFEALTIIPFHLPLALLGVDPFIYASCYAIDLIYQFWIHTELPGRLGWLEYVLNTPSSHRVHHGINRQVSGPQLRRNSRRLGSSLRLLPARRGAARLRRDACSS